MSRCEKCGSEDHYGDSHDDAMRDRVARMSAEPLERIADALERIADKMCMEGLE